MSTNFEVLRTAASGADMAALRGLVQAGADLNVRSPDGTPLLRQVIMDMSTPGQRDALSTPI